MKEYPQLEPISLRDEAQPGYEKIAWKPTWRCFCCAACEAGKRR